MRKKWQINVKSHKSGLNISSSEDVLNEIYYNLIKSTPILFKIFSKIVNLENILLIQTS